MNHQHLNTVESSDDDDINDFLIPPPQHHRSRLPPGATMRVESVRTPSDSDEDDGFLRPASSHTHDLPPPYFRGASPPHAVAVNGASSIVAELEREIAHWKEIAEQGDLKCRAMQDENKRWRQGLFSLLTTLSGDDAVALEATAAYLRHIAALADQRRLPPSLHFPSEAVVGSAAQFVEAVALRLSSLVPAAQPPMLSAMITPLRGTAASVEPSSGPLLASVEDIERSDEDKTQQTNERHVWGTRSAARSLRRQRHLAGPLLVMPPPRSLVTKQSTVSGGLPVGQMMSSVLLNRFRSQVSTLQGAWLTQAYEQCVDRCRRGRFKAWKQWAEQRHIHRLVRHPTTLDGQQHRRLSLAHLAANQLHARHVVEGSLRRLWNRWIMFILCRRQLRQVERQMGTLAEHGALLGSLIRNHDALWGDFVSDAAMLLDHQCQGLTALKHNAADAIVYQRPKEDRLSLLQ